MKGIRMERSQKLAKHIVIVDGPSCSGKSLVCPLISTMRRSELWLTDHIYEYLSAMHGHGRIPRDAASALVRLYADFDLYNLQIGRYTNLRPTDTTGAAMNLLEGRYQRRLSIGDGDVVVRRIRRTSPILILMTHFIFNESDLLFDAFGARLKLYVMTMRHPLSLLRYWHGGNWDNRIGRDPREFQLSYRAGKKIVPWYAFRWAKHYQALRPYEKSIVTVVYLIDSFKRKLKTVSKQKKEKLLLIPFEKFAMNPDPVMGKIASRLGTVTTPLTQRMIKRLWNGRKDPLRELEAQRTNLEGVLRKERVSSKIRSALERVCREYEEEYL